MKKPMAIIFAVFLLSPIFAKDAIFLKTVKINGVEETKKFKISCIEEYNRDGNLIRHTTDTMDTAIFYNKDGVKVKELTTYDPRGLEWLELNKDTNLFENKKAEDFIETNYFYNEDGNIVKIIRTGAYVDNLDRTEFDYFYDLNGNLVRMVETETYKDTQTKTDEKYYYDGNGKKYMEKIGDEATVYIHDEKRNLTIISSDRKNTFIVIETDNNDREIYFKQIDDENEKPFERWTSYDDENKTMTQKDSSGGFHFSSYNNFSMLLHRIEIKGAKTEEMTVTYQEPSKTPETFYATKKISYGKEERWPYIQFNKDREDFLIWEAWYWDNENLSRIVEYTETK